MGSLFGVKDNIRRKNLNIDTICALLYTYCFKVRVVTDAREGKKFIKRQKFKFYHQG